MAIVGGQSLKKLKTETGDRISELPKNLIEHILESMPLQDAVRTSALARNWRYKWTTISKLAFDKSFWRYLLEKGIKKVESIRSVITQVLLLLDNNPIQSFDLYMPNTEWGDSSNWMLILARKGVKKLTLAGGKFGGIREKLPSLKKLKTETGDRISELPNNLIEHILESMPIQDAVRTSALARNWRYKWTTISKLDFDKSFLDYLVKNGKDKVEFIRFIITQVLLLLGNNPIHSFHLYMPNAEWGDSSNWMLILARKGVKKLTLAGGKLSGIRQKLPSHIFTCLELTHLHICGCHFNIPSNFRGFPNLISLELVIVVVYYESFRCFIANCRLLERMTLKGILGNLNIHSLSLKHLYISGNFESIWIDAKLLKTMSVNPNTLMSADPQTGVGSMFKALGMLPEIENLSLGCEAVEFLPAVGAPMALPTPLTFLKKLVLSVNFSRAAQICSALCLIRSAPSLMELEITAIDDDDDVEPVSCYLGDDIMLSCLKVVKFWRIYYLKPQLEMIQSLLASSPYLEKMFVEAFPKDDEKVDKKITSDLLRFVRLSPKAEIIYTEICEAHLFEHLR